MERVNHEQPNVPLDLSHHLSQEAQKRLPNMMKTFLRSLEGAPQMLSLANGTLFRPLPS